MINVHTLTFSPFQENTYVVWDETKEAIVVDPGCYDASEEQALKGFIESNELKVVKIVNTHCHLDHVFGNKFCQDTFGVKLYIPKGEIETLASGANSAAKYGIPGFVTSTHDELLENEGEVTFGNTSLQILYAPGHSPGHLVFFDQEQKIALGGDVLFKGSIGRTDLPGGDHQTLLDNIKNVMYALPDETIVYPGHGPFTTIGDEKRSNPFVRG
ncbi:MBL fold metallo-hydrolase [Flammeovirga sp. EKP202]|uniref:MBL fold metallo-hydrolase n=1 Tax=Flammeovirga sp. EKP202 TaxID=2770592 RepID=UPI00165F0F61|nr:MBL fold metallo-hydrolase [Flammeovirga sp. EKP202]MBD0403000.1 MBL fold metallo-hydrolase [Flammeovirga sp. EKP202]